LSSDTRLPTRSEILLAQLVERRWSFVGRVGGEPPLFVKVPKATADTSLEDALRGIDEQRLARLEKETLETLSKLNSSDVRVPAPVGIVDGVILVTREIPQLRPLADALAADEGLECLEALGRWLRSAHDTHPGRIIDGFKLDNIELDPAGGVVLFDPNEFQDGEETSDVARFVVSLLARAYEHGALPRRSSVAHCLAFLRGYGTVSPTALHASAQAWLRRLRTELEVSAKRRLGHGAVVARPWLYLHERMLRLRFADVIDALQAADPISGRYDDPSSAQTYREQQDADGHRNLRLGLLARAEVRQIRSQILASGVRSRVLDLPGGTGKLWPTFAELGVECVSGDLSEYMLNEGDVVPGVTPIVMDGRRIPFADGSFDGVVSLRLFHRVSPETRETILGEFSRVAARWLVVSYARSDSLYGVRHRLRSRLARTTQWAPHPASRSQIRDELAAAGFELLAIRPVAGLLSNEVVVRARKAQTGELHSDTAPVCPRCNGDLVTRPHLECAACGSRYRMHGNIPILLVTTEDPE
jgi:hypothetical protein